MGRRELREQIFKLLFRVEFHEKEDMPEQLVLFLEEAEEQKDRGFFQKSSQSDQTGNNTYPQNQ